MKCFVSFAYFDAEGRQGFGNGMIKMLGKDLKAKDVTRIVAWADDLVQSTPDVYGPDAKAVVLNMIPVGESLF